MCQGAKLTVARKVYSYFTPDTLEIPSAILGGIALCVTIPIYIFYWKGPAIRKRSKFAQVLASDKKTSNERRKSRVGGSIA